MKQTQLDIPEVLDYKDGEITRHGGLCDRCGGDIDAGDRTFLSKDGVQCICYGCANQEEWEEMVESDRREMFAYLEKLSTYQTLEAAGLLDPEVRKPTPPVFGVQF